MMGRKIERWRQPRQFTLEQAFALVQPKRVLLAEDDALLRGLLAWALRAQGYEVVEARDGSELVDYLGTALLRGDRNPVDLIITDIRMPGWSGMQALASLRDTDWAIPVIIITGYKDAEMRREASRLGAAALFEKPFEVHDLLTAVVNLLPAEETGAPAARPS